jgi:hypothetical protein
MNPSAVTPAPAPIPVGTRLGWPAQLRRFAAAGLALGFIFILELLLLSTFAGLRSSVYDGFRRSYDSVQLTLLGVIVAVVALIAGLGMLRRRRTGFLRINLWFGLAVATILTLGLVAIAWLPSVEIASNLTVPAALFLLVLLVGVPAAAIWTVRWLGRRSRWGILAGWLGLVPVFAYLATDDPTLNRNTTLEEIAPAFPGSEKSFEVLMRYGKRHPLAKDPLATRGPQRIWQNFVFGMSTNPSEPEKFRRFLTAQRAAIEADWADLAPIRAWWAELAAFERLGDLTPASPAAEILAFQPMRSYTQLAVAIAGLQALDGQGDAAFATLQPLIEVSRKLEPSSRTLSRSMMAKVSQGAAMAAAQFVLDTTPVSPAARARFGAALASGVTGEVGARRLIAIESAYVMALFEGMGTDKYLVFPHLDVGPLNQLLRLASSVLYNPRRTSNTYWEMVTELQDMAAHRDHLNMNARAEAFLAGPGRPRFKNFLGGIALRQSTTSYGSVIRSYWDIEDRRLALLTRLTQP